MNGSDFEFSLFSFVEVLHEGLEEVRHPLFIADEIAEAGFSLFLGREVGFVNQLADVEEETVRTVVAMETDFSKEARGDADGRDLAEELFLVVKECCRFFFQVGIVGKARDRRFENAIVEDVVAEFIEFADHSALSPRLLGHACGEIEAALE